MSHVWENFKGYLPFFPSNYRIKKVIYVVDLICFSLFDRVRIETSKTWFQPVPGHLKMLLLGVVDVTQRDIQ